MSIVDMGDENPRKKEIKETWKKPEKGWTKLNVDADVEISGLWGAIL
jgi:hypothetical protein